MNLRINKAASAAGGLSPETEMDAINALTQKELTAEEVFVFRCVACDDQVDRDYERFPVETLEKLAPLFVGKPVIADHRWSAEKQVARIYSAGVELREGTNALVVRCYMLRNDSTKDVIAAIEGGILKEVSVGCAVEMAVCAICGEEYGSCGHRKGEMYEGKTCYAELVDPVDAYEMSFVAVPAQPGAGVTKQMENTGWSPEQRDAAGRMLAIEHERWKF